MPSDSPELRRILDLPVRPDVRPLPPLLEKWAPKLRPAQIAALSELAAMPAPCGIYGDIGVGAGKFLICMLAGALLGLDRVLIITDAQLIGQARSEIDRFVQVFPETVDHMPTLLAYEHLSRPESVYELDKRAPQLVMLDEAHRLCGANSARTNRVLNYAIQNPKVRWCVLSGTLQRKSLLDIAHLAELALRDGSFLPTDSTVLAMWSAVLDQGAKPSAAQLRYFDPLLAWAGTQDVNEAYARRFKSTPGVVSIQSEEAACSLRIRKRVYRPGAEIANAIKGLQDRWELPDGTELVDTLEYVRHSATISLGFFYRTVYPEGSEAWQEARKTWNRELRTQIQYRRYGDLDSPARVERAAEQGRGVPQSLIDAYRAWVAIRDTVEPEQTTNWLTMEVIDVVAEYMRRRKRGLVWYGSRAVEAALEERGLPCFGGGMAPPADDVPVAALSHHSHGTGKNLQAWNYQLILEPSASAGWWQQLLGRTHRYGQKADEVIAEVLTTTWYQRAQVFGAWREAGDLQTRFGTPFRLVNCDWLDDAPLLGYTDNVAGKNASG